jgi:hypothetical protein
MKTCVSFARIKNKALIMRKVYLLVLLAFGLKGFTQTEMAVSSSVNKNPETPLGSVIGM